MKGSQEQERDTPNDLGAEAARAIAAALNTLLADMFALYMKTKNFHWHMSGPHFHDFHLLLDAQADKIFAATDVIAGRVRKIGAPTLRSIGEISRRQRVPDSDAERLTPFQMLAELRDDNLQLAACLRETHGVCDEQGDVASASILGKPGSMRQSRESGTSSRRPGTSRLRARKRHLYDRDVSQERTSKRGDYLLD